MKKKEKLVMGWRESLDLPDLEVKQIRVKVDTGAQTSALHATELHFYQRRGVEYVEFFIHPVQHSSRPYHQVRAEVVDRRRVKSSTGHGAIRPVITTVVDIGGISKEIEVTLVNRDLMGFRMLLGRQALRGDFMVDPGRSFLLSEKRKKA